MKRRKSELGAMSERQNKDIILLNNIRQSLIEIQDGKYIEFSSVEEFKKKLSQYL